MTVPRRRLAKLGLALAGTLLLWTAKPGSMPRYLGAAAQAQAQMLWLRQPIDEVLARGELSEAHAERLGQVDRIKGFGAKIGLAHTDNYSRISLGWDHTIYNVTGSEPLAFEPVVFWFPVVGSFPYLGFFDRDQASAHASGLQRQGKDVWVRTAGAYSTLGWFEDPILPHMLDWDEYSLAGTLLHELAHATLWVPGSVQFNESFANFVGDEAAMAYLIDTYGEDHELVAEARARVVDRERWREVMHGVYSDLEAVYADSQLSDSEKRRAKREIFGAVPLRLAKADLRRPERWIAWSRRTTWNNSRMLQFRTYNNSLASFRALWESNDEDLGRFLDAIREVGEQGGDPYEALDRAVGAGAHRN